MSSKRLVFIFQDETDFFEYTMSKKFVNYLVSASTGMTKDEATKWFETTYCVDRGWFPLYNLTNCPF